MPIVAADLEAWLSVNNPEDDTSSSGGAIQDDAHTSGGITPVMTQLAATDQVEIVSDDAGDTARNFSITGRNAAGAIISEGPTSLNGTTFVTSTNTYERILKCTLSAKHATATVTLRRATDDATIMVLGPNVIEGRRMFYDSSSSGSAENRYELTYMKNSHGTLTLNSAAVELTGDPASKIFMGLEAAKGDAGAETNRKTAPGSVTFVDDSVSQSVPTGTLAAGERIGTWLRQTLAADDSPVKNTWTLELSGTTV